jgi:DNA-directed RNA polymerase specialized sigma24 family protein
MQQQEEHQLANRSDSTLYDRHAAIILAYARSHTATWQDAEDLTLEVFLTALEHDNLSWLSNQQQHGWLLAAVRPGRTSRTSKCLPHGGWWKDLGERSHSTFC